MLCHAIFHESWSVRGIIPKGFTLFAIPLSLAEAALLGQDVVNKHFIKAGAVLGAVEAAIKTRSPGWHLWCQNEGSTSC